MKITKLKLPKLNYLNLMNSCLYITGFIFLALYMFGMSVYSGYTADHNRPDDDSSGLFIASYVICIIQCIIYLGGFFYAIFLGLSGSGGSSSESSSGSSNSSLPFLLNIYWLVVFFNYNVSDKYDEYALVKTVEFFMVFGLFVLGIGSLSIINCFCINDNITIPENTNDKNKDGIISTV